ncbi:MAG: cysteine rich repeat-containing protein [Rhodospirillaceae bacterium]
MLIEQKSNIMPRLYRSAAVLAVCLLGTVATPAFAQTAAPPAAAKPSAVAVPATAVPEVAPACAADAKKFCAGVHPGAGKITECLKKNLETLAPDCKVTVAEGRPTVPPSPCKGDIERLCPTVEPGLGRIGECLRKNSTLLTAQCRTYQIRIKD